MKSKSKGKKLIAYLLVILMLLTSAPFGILSDSDIIGTKASAAAGLSGYNALAAAQWAKEHVGERTSVLFGTRYWYDGGDCANFVSECMYMGGIDPNPSWNHQGYFAHFAPSSDGSWIRATQLYDYAVSIGGQSIRNPSAGQIEVGDLIFFKKTSGGRFTHSSIVVEAENGNVKIAAHSTNLTAYITSNWHLEFSGSNTYLVKMHGATCTQQTVRNFDVYKVRSTTVGYASTNTNSRVFRLDPGEYAHVYETRTVNGATWGYTFCYGKWGWAKLSGMSYMGHYKTGPVDHLMGPWKVTVEPTCSTVGVEERICSRCGYKETRNMAIGGKHKNVVPATCLSPSYCTACGETIAPALGHDWDEWNTDKAPTCLNDGTEKRDCFRCGYRETRKADALGHNYQAVVSLPGCTTSGTTNYQCTRCKDSYIESAEWSGYMDINTSDPKYAEFLGNSELSRSRKEYSYRTKSTTTRTNTTGTAPNLTGYTLYNTSWVWNPYGNWSGWQDGYVSENEYRQVQTTQVTTYNYWHNSLLRVDGTRTTVPVDVAEYNRIADANGYIKATSLEYHTIALENQLSYYKKYTDTHGNTWDQYTGHSCCNSIDGSSSVDKWFYSGTGSKTKYSYRDRTKQYTYSYYKWSNWSDWTTTVHTKTDTKEVKDRTTYSFKQSVMGHNWDDGVVVEPTCLEGGYKLYTCKRCGITMKTEEKPALGHDLRDENSELGWHVISDDGAIKVYRRDCQRHCGYYEIKSETCYFEPVETVDPTCTEDGYTLYRCVNHSNEEYKSDIVPALGHKADEQWTVTKAPTCTENGEEQCRCVRYDGGKTCDHIYTREIKAVGHDLVKTEKVDMACEKDGMEEYYTCKNCNAVFADEKAETPTTLEELIIPATGHSRVNADGEEVWITEQEAACGVTGREMLYCQNEHCDVTEKCENCGEKHHKLLDEREIAEIEPNYILVDHTESTCIKPGIDTYSCLNCIGTDHEHGWTEILDLKPHTFGEWEEGNKPLCIYPGDETRHCLVCGFEEYREVPAEYDSHDFETITTDPTCTGSGESYKKCTRCGEEEGKETIDPTGHDMHLDAENSYAPTCTEPGVNHYVCSRGDYEYDEYIDPIGHDYEQTSHIPATCTTPGEAVYTCKNDASHTYSEILTDEPMLGHEFDEWYTVREPNYAQTRIDRRDCIRHDKTEYRELPKLDRPVEENEAVENGKTATYDPETGEVTITLKTWSEAEKLVEQNLYAMPLDIVLVVDQSGSMEGKRLASLTDAVEQFINLVYNDAVERKVDHRIAVAGFAMGVDVRNSGFAKYLNTELFTGKNGIVGYNKLRAGDANYSSALVPVNEDGKLNSRLTGFDDKLDAKGATQADLGLEMANNVFGANPIKDNERQRVVVFMTDGEPTTYSGFGDGVANAAIKQAGMLKNTYGAAVYSVGFMIDDQAKTDKFVNYVSSNYPDSSNMNRPGKKSAENFCSKTSSVDGLSEIFKSIATETTTYYTNFKNLTLIDTVSNAFTMTTAQETQLRQDAMVNLGVRNEDITVTRHENGCTTVQVTGINPKQVTENGRVIYRTELSFKVSANENALKKGEYTTNEDDSGVSLDGETFVTKFASPTIKIDSDRGIAIFNVDGEPFQIVSVKIGGGVEAPNYTIDNNLKWDVPDGYTLSGGTVTFDAESTNTHKHDYKKIALKEADCGNNGKTEYLCDCGAHYIETTPATGEHRWEAVRSTANEDEFSFNEFRCTVCGEFYKSEVLYKLVHKTLADGLKAETATSVTEEIRFGTIEDSSRQPNDTVSIVAAVGEYFSVSRLENINVYRVEADGSHTKLNSSYEDGVVTFETNHFCRYIFEAVYVCQSDGSHRDFNKDGCCDECGKLISEIDAYRCKMCDTYEANKDKPVIGIFYKIVHYFVHLMHFISHKT